jgi:hypothetical protein
MVDKLDQGLMPAELGPLDYKGLYNVMTHIFFFFLFFWNGIQPQNLAVSIFYYENSKEEM